MNEATTKDGEGLRGIYPKEEKMVNYLMIGYIYLERFPQIEHIS